MSGTEPAPPDTVPPDRTASAPGGANTYRWASFGVVAAATALIEVLYASAPVPPGVDPGDWVQRSYAFVGLPHPPVMAVGSPYLYPPVIFPPLGLLMRLTGDPMETAEIFAGLLLVLLGLSAIALAERYLASPPLRLAFTALAVGNGLTLSMFFWGGYPNLLALVFFDLAFVGLLALVRDRSGRGALLFAGMAALVYLTHSLTFAMLGASVVGALVFVALSDPRRLRVLGQRSFLAGVALLGGVVVAYTALSALFHIPHPGYFYSNPAAFTIDQLGELFQPVASAPMLGPAGPALILGSTEMFVLLAALAGALFLVAFLVERYRPGWMTDPIRLTAGWLCATLAVPDLGYLARIATDYTRFVYYLPFPLLLGAMLVLERAVTLVRAGRAAPDATGAAAPARERLHRPPAGASLGMLLLVGAFVLLLFVSVSVPVAAQNETMDTGRSHDAEFLAAVDWLRQDPEPGAVLTTSSTARWTEAITDRGAYDPGPTWLLFEPWQVANAEESYWALGSSLAVTDNAAAYGFSSAPGSADGFAPLYAPYVLGIPVPTLRLVPSGSYLVTTSANGTERVPFGSYATPANATEGPEGALAEIRFGTPQAPVFETVATTTPSVSYLNLTVRPARGTSVPELGVELAAPPGDEPVLHAGALENLTGNLTTLDWNVRIDLGQMPQRSVISTTTTFTPAPISLGLAAPPAPRTAANLVFPNPDPTAPFSVSVALRTNSTSNPADQLPEILSTGAFLATHDIRFLLLPNSPQFNEVVSMYESLYGYHVGFWDPEWAVLASTA